MVLRKPYAFLIKHFRLIHLIITGVFGYIVIKNRQIYAYIKKVIADSANRYDVASYINYKVFIYIFIALALCFVIHWLLKYKDKPRKIYIFTIVGYAIVSIFMLILFSYMSGFLSNIIDQKTIRLYRDIMTITLFFQYYIIIIMAIRGLGFDIKKFDFKRDVQELNLVEEDSEEVEVNLAVDTTNIARGIRKSQREFGYFFKEYKLYILIILAVVLGILGYNGYNYFNKKYKIYSENDFIGSIDIMVVRDSYYKIEGSNNYVIINFDIFNDGYKEQLNTGNVLLMVGNKKYSPDKNICYKFNSLGACYKKQYLTKEINNYILTYSVDELNIQEAYLLYSESYDKTYKVKLIMKEY